MSASAFSLTAICLAADFEVLRGETVIAGARDPAIRHFFCPDCMTWMFTRPAVLPHVVNVRPTMFDDHAWFRPYMETFTKTRLPWAVTGAVVSFNEFPSMEAYEGLISASASRRLPRREHPAVNVSIQYCVQ